MRIRATKSPPVARRIQEQDLQAIEDAVRAHPGAVTAQQVADALEAQPPRRTLQYRLKSLVDEKRSWTQGHIDPAGVTLAA
jgi:hypothetical protein